MAEIVVGFKNLGVPATGLAATIRIRRIDTQALVVTDDPMTEQGDGGYSYTFAPVDGLEYSIRADGTATLPAAERFAFGSLSGTTEARLEVDVPAILVDTGTSLPSDIAAVQADTDDIQTRLPGALVGGRMDSDVAVIQPAAITASAIAANAITAAKIATDAIGADELASSAVNEIVDQTWEEQVGDHSGTGGSTAEALVAAAGTTSPAVIAAAVWDALTSAHGGAGTFGRAANTIAEEATVQAAPAPTTTTFATDLDEADGFWSNMLVVVIEAASGNAVARNIDGYTLTDGLITVDALPFTPVAGDIVLVLRRVIVNPEIVPSNRPD